MLEKELKKLQDLIDTLRWFKGIKEIVEGETIKPKTLANFVSNGIEIIV